MTGIICIDKPQGMTSFSAVKKAARILGVKKAGHTGTLDPMATGVLVVMLSGCTRFSELLPEHKKSYRARVSLGIVTDTLDITGKVLSRQIPHVTEEQLSEACSRFTGGIMQTPPMFSAVKKDGKRLYSLARQGIVTEREQRKVIIESLKVYGFDGSEFCLDITCSAGTYIRSLCDDIGSVLGCGAALKELRRTAANGFSVENAVTLERLEQLKNENRAEQAVIPLEKALSAYSEIEVTSAQAKRFYNGGELDGKRLGGYFEAGIYRVYSPERKLLGLGEILNGGGDLTVKRVLVSDE